VEDDIQFAGHIQSLNCLFFLCFLFFGFVSGIMWVNQIGLGLGTWKLGDNPNLSLLNSRIYFAFLSAAGPNWFATFPSRIDICQNT